MIPYQAPTPGTKPLFPTTPLIDSLKQDHQLVIMAKKIDWNGLVESFFKFSKFYDSDQGCPILPLRLMIGLKEFSQQSAEAVCLASPGRNGARRPQVHRSLD
jgi:hypothetical protein